MLLLQRSIYLQHYSKMKLAIRKRVFTVSPKGILARAGLGLACTFGMIAIHNIAPLIPGSDLTTKQVIFNNVDETANVTDETVKEGQRFNDRYFAVVISARAGHQTSQDSMKIQVGHTTLLLQHTWLEAKWNHLSAGSYLTYETKESMTTISTKGGNGFGFWSIDDDKPLMDKYFEARKLGKLKYKGTSFLVTQITKEGYLKFIPKSKGGKEESMTSLFCLGYILQPMASEGGVLCNCTSAVNTVAKAVGVTGLTSTNPTAMSAYIDKQNNIDWTDGQLLPIKLAD
jgi:hypothetical protein